MQTQNPKVILFPFSLFIYIIYKQVLFISILKCTLNSFTFCHYYKPNVNHCHLLPQLLPWLWLYLQNISRIPLLLTPSLPSITLFKPLSYEQDYYHSDIFFPPLPVYSQHSSQSAFPNMLDHITPLFRLT